MKLDANQVALGKRLTWDNAGPAPFESAWSVLMKIEVLNAVNFAELAKLGLVTKRSISLGQLFTSVAHWNAQRVADYISINVSKVHSGFADCLGFPSSGAGEYNVRHCPECKLLAYHCALFNILPITRCPWHDVPLAAGCASCARLALVDCHRGSKRFERLECKRCGYILDPQNTSHINRVPSYLHKVIETHCGDLINWWSAARRGAGNASVLLAPLAYCKWSQVTSDLLWRLSWATRLACPPERWGIPIPEYGVDAWLERPSTDAETVARLPRFARIYRSVRQAIFARVIRPHVECLSELMQMGPFDRISLDSFTLCTACIAYLSWRTAHEGRMPFVNAYTGRWDRLTLRPARIDSGFASEPDQAQALYANFIRIWAQIEDVVKFSALRIVRIENGPQPLNIPQAIVTNELDRSAIWLLPRESNLSEIAVARCNCRRSAQTPMSRFGAAYANGGWNAVVDPHLLFTARNHQSGFRNAYSYIYV
jgi:hypothetical protein